MTDHDDLATSLRSAAGRFDPDSDGWAGIQGGIRAAHRRRRARVGALGGLAAGGLVLAVGLSLAGGDGTDVDAGPGPFAATTEAPPTTTEPTTSETTVPPAPTTTVPTADPMATAFPGIWPFASAAAIAAYEDGDARFEDPVATAVAFAQDYVGMLDPVAEEVYLAGDAAGERRSVELRPKGEDGQPVPDGGARTTVLLRPYPTSYGVDVWTVISASSDNLVLDEPSRGDEASGGVVRVRGQGTGYEGHVQAEVRQDGMQLGRTLGQVIGITGSMGELGPLSLDVPFTTPSEPGGAVLVTTDTGLDGVGVPEFTVVRVHFAEPSSVGPADPVEPEAGDEPPGPASCSPPPPLGEPAADEMDVTVFFICAAAAGADPEAEETFVPVTRRTLRTAGVLGATMEVYLGGATDEEERSGVGSLTYHAAIEVDVTLVGTTAIIDIDGEVVNDANGVGTSAGSALFLGSLHRTVFQFPTVDAVEYRLDGSCEAFWLWHQMGGCPIVTRDDL